MGSLNLLKLSDNWKSLRGFYPLVLAPAGGAGPPVNTTDRFLQRPSAWGWFRFGLLWLLWLFRVCGGFVCPFRLFGCAFGVGLCRPAWRWFRLSLMLVRLWCWFWSFAFGLGFGRVRWFRFIFSFVRRLVLVDPGQKLGSLRNKLAVFQ